jgi:hypothetical protein
VKLAVVGSRDYDPSRYWIVRNEIQSIAYRVGWDNIELVSGGARGVDSMAAQAARHFDIPITVFPADWKRHGRRAGMIRNAQIVEIADELLAFFGAERTPGTSDTVRRAAQKGIPVWVSDSGGIAERYAER